MYNYLGKGRGLGYDAGMKLQWLSHAGFRLEVGPYVLLIDPFLSGNSTAPFGWEEAARGCTHILLTHGHSDHTGDTLAIAKQTGCTVVGMVELVSHLAGKQPGLKIEMANLGGTVQLGGGLSVTLVPAWHSAASDDGAYLGVPAGLVLRGPGMPTVYHMGDTSIFGDMALIQELYKPEIGLVPIGDRFTMDGPTAALACRRYFQFKTIVPIHYATFGLLAPDAGKFVEAGEGLPIRVMKPGEVIEV
jgi:L-ascorbate metabolism protein UlaG (beta-lactamase superfamily)